MADPCNLAITFAPAQTVLAARIRVDERYA